MALEILNDPSIHLCTLIGQVTCISCHWLTWIQAGTGKTLMALAAGLEQVFKYHRYERILITRPIMPMGKVTSIISAAVSDKWQDIGYLPGSKDEKLLPWMQPIFDNLAFLVFMHSVIHDWHDWQVPKKSTAENKYALLSELEDENGTLNRRKKRSGSFKRDREDSPLRDSIIENMTLDTGNQLSFISSLMQLKCSNAEGADGSTRIHQRQKHHESIRHRRRMPVLISIKCHVANDMCVGIWHHMKWRQSSADVVKARRWCSLVILIK